MSDKSYESKMSTMEKGLEIMKLEERLEMVQVTPGTPEVLGSQSHDTDIS